MNKAKNQNSILVLATLGVYLGLVLVGATPQVLAQNSKPAERNKINLFIPSQGLIFTVDLNPILELNRLATGSSYVKVSGKSVFGSKESSNWESINTAGTERVTDFIARNFFGPSTVNPPSIAIPFKELFQTVEINKESIIFDRIVKCIDANKAEEMADVYRHIAEYAQLPNADKGVAGNLYLINTAVRHENDQVFIVTRLPRAGLDSLLASNAK